MTRRGLGNMFGWAATLLGYRERPASSGESDEDEGSLHTGEVGRVRDLSEQVATQSDSIIRGESARLGAVVGELLAAARPHLVPGSSTRRVADALVDACWRHDVAPAMLGYSGFPAGAAVSINDEIVHGIPSRRQINDGDLVKIELGVVSGKAFAAQSWTFPIGSSSATDALMLATGRKALTSAIAAVSPTMRLGDIGAAIQSTTEAAGLSVVRSFVGYGIGQKRIQPPQIPGVGRAGIGMRLRPGMILNLHVIIKQGSPEVDIAPNKWTAVASDGLRGALFTSMVEVTGNGNTRLTNDIET